MKNLLLALFTLLLLGGCAFDMEDSVMYLPREAPSCFGKPDYTNLYRSNSEIKSCLPHLKIGSTKAEVLKLIGRPCPSNDILRFHSGYGLSETYVYGPDYRRDSPIIVSFDNGKLSWWSE